jgi:hypothetical protein
MGANDASPPLLWLGFLVLGALSLVDGILLGVFGAEAVQGTIQDQLGTSWQEFSAASPVTAQYVNTLVVLIGLLIAGYSLFVIVVAVTGYRKGHRWAWYAMWNPAVFFLLLTALFVSRGDIFTSDALSPEFMIGMLIAATLFQLMGYSKFFAKRR